MASVSDIIPKRGLGVVSEFPGDRRQGGACEGMERRERVPHRVERYPVESLAPAVGFESISRIKSITPTFSRRLVGPQQVGGQFQVARIDDVQVDFEKIEQSGRHPDQPVLLVFRCETVRVADRQHSGLEINPVAPGLDNFLFSQPGKEPDMKHQGQIGAVSWQGSQQLVSLLFRAIPFRSSRQRARQIDAVDWVAFDESLASGPGEESTQPTQLAPDRGRGKFPFGHRVLESLHMACIDCGKRLIAQALEERSQDHFCFLGGSLRVSTLRPSNLDKAGSLHPHRSARKFASRLDGNRVVFFNRFFLIFCLERDGFWPNPFHHRGLKVKNARVRFSIQSPQFHRSIFATEKTGSKFWKQKQAAVYPNQGKTRVFGLVSRGLFPSGAVGSKSLRTPVSLGFSDGRDDWIRTSDPHNPMMGVFQLVALVAFFGSKFSKRKGFV